MATRAEAVPAAEQNPSSLPSAETLSLAAGLPVLAADGTPHPFATLSAPTLTPRTLIVFLRHMFCGVCADYVRALADALPPPLLARQSPPVRLVLISCGEPSLIPHYVAATNCPFDIYCDPTRQLYARLGMQCNLALGATTPAYVRAGFVSTVLSSAASMLGSGTKMFRGGDKAQNGGEWLFEGGVLTWCHRMRNTRDHAEVEEIERVLGIERRE